jgi:TatD DNase family protein
LSGVVERAAAAGVGGLLAIGIGDGPGTMHRALEIAEGPLGAEFGVGIWASAGIHPQEALAATAENLARLRELAGRPKCVAVGEIGLDYYHVENPEIAVQQEAFRAQMAIAAEVRKPILIHCRTSALATPEAKARFGSADAEADLIAMVEAHWTPVGVPGVMHCFSGDVDHARRSLDAGFYLSFAGNVTYPKAVGIREAAAFVPADRVLVETDAPFLAPIPLRGQRNEPGYVAYTAAAVAELRGISAEALAELTTANFRRLFGV